MMPWQNMSVDDLPEEQWRYVTGYEGWIQVSNLGRFKRLKRTVKNPLMDVTYPIKILKQKQGMFGMGKRLSVRLKRNGTHRHIASSRLVASHWRFNDDPVNKTHVNHIDGVPYNNAASNLEWCTPSENQKHAYRIGLQKPTVPMLGRQGSRCPNSKKIDQFTTTGVFIRTWDSQTCVQRELSIQQAKVSAVCLGKRKTAGKFIWKFHQTIIKK